MNYIKLLLILITVILTSACRNDLPQVLIGSTILEKDEETGEEYSFSSDRILVLSQDSLEFIPLWQRGCMFSPANPSKLKTFQGDDDIRYMLTEEDTIEFNLEYKGGNIYSNTINGIEFQYDAAVDKKININYHELLELFTGKSYQFTKDDRRSVISFHEEDIYMMNQKIKNEEVITKGRWLIKEAGKYSFLIIDDFENIRKFQILNISDAEINIYNSNTDNREEIILSEVQSDDLFFNKEFFSSKLNQNPPFATQHLKVSNSSYEIWFNNNETFISYDSSTIDNLDTNLKPASVFIDWACKAIIADNDLFFGFEIDIMNENKINLFPINKKGRLIRKYSKAYYYN